MTCHWPEEPVPLSQSNASSSKSDVSLCVTYTAPLPETFSAGVLYIVCIGTGEFECGTVVIIHHIFRGSNMSKGTVKWFNSDKGFGFITPEDGGKDLFVHHSEIQMGGGYATLNDGQAVEFEVGQGQKGPCANKVVPL